MKNKAIKPIIVIPNFISVKQCDKIIGIGNEQTMAVEQFGADEGRYSYVSEITPCKYVPEYLKIQDKLHKLNKKYYDYELSREIGTANFLKYSKNNFTAWHHDGYIGSEYPERKLSAVIMLSNGFDGTGGSVDYEGGNFELPHYFNTLDGNAKRKGTLLLFPSYMFHQVTKVTKGTRYTLAFFMKGPKFK